MMEIRHFISIFFSLFVLTSIFFTIILTFSVILYQSVKMAGIFIMLPLTMSDNQNPVFKTKILLKNYILASIYIFFLGILLYINIMIFEYIFYISTFFKLKVIFRINVIFIITVYKSASIYKKSIPEIFQELFICIFFSPFSHFSPFFYQDISIILFITTMLDIKYP